MKVLTCGLLSGLILLSWAGASKATLGPQDPAPSTPSTQPSGQPDSEQIGIAAERLQELAALLSLTADQREKVRPILLAEAPRLKAVRDDTSMSKRQKADKLREIFKATDAKMKPILTPDQMQKLQRIREDAIKKRLAAQG
jgi:periplasmic protein CpxP/Spy